MDPLSITATAVALVAAANSIVTTVNTFTRSLRAADTRLTELTNELAHLTSFLRTVQSTLKGHRAYDLSHFDDTLWQQSEIALSTCQTTLNELSLVVKDIQLSSGKVVIGRRARLVASLNSKAVELQSLRDRIAKSNLALQTILQTITVSLSLRNNASQSLILRGLDDLQASIDRVISRSWQNAGRLHETAVYPHADAQMNRNLRDLAQAAKHFHSAASSTASSAANSARSDDDANSTAPWQSYPGADVSLFGDFSDDLRERVEEYVREAPSAVNVEVPRKPKHLPLKRSMSPKLRMAAVEEDEVEEDEDEDTDDEDDAEFELAFVKGLQELISHHIRTGNYKKAIDFINEAMSNSAVLSSSTMLRTLQCQLVLSHLLQGQWRLASSLLTTTLARLKRDRDPVICSLLHGLAIAHLAEYDFDDALAACKMSLYGRKRLHKRGEIEEKFLHETTSLFATIYDMTGDYVRAEVLRCQLPSDFVYQHPESSIAFLLREQTLQELSKGDMAVSENSSNNASIIPGVFELADKTVQLPVGLQRRATTTSLISPLRTRICEHERFENDTAKEVILAEPASPGADADDEASLLTLEDERVPKPLHRRLTQIFRGGRPKKPTMKAAPMAVKEEEETAYETPNDSGYGTCSATENTTPTSVWRLKDFGAIKRAKTKNLLKKQQPGAKKDKEPFKVLHAERKAKVDGVSPSAEATTEFGGASSTEDGIAGLARHGTDGQLAELEVPGENRTVEDRAVAREPLQQPQQSDLSRFAEWVNPATLMTDSSSADTSSTFSGGRSSSRATRPSKLQIPASDIPGQQQPLTIPSLNSRNLTQQILCPRLSVALASLAECFTVISSLKTSQEIDLTIGRLNFLLGELRTYGFDKCLEGDVEDAMRRLQRRSWRSKKWEKRDADMVVEADQKDETKGKDMRFPKHEPSISAMSEPEESPAAEKRHIPKPQAETPNFGPKETDPCPEILALRGQRLPPRDLGGRRDVTETELELVRACEELRRHMLRSQKLSFDR